MANDCLEKIWGEQSQRRRNAAAWNRGTQMRMDISAPSKTQDAFVSFDHSRDYKRIYRAAYDFHEQHTPPPCNAADCDYKDRIYTDAVSVLDDFDNDPFLLDLLNAVCSELIREIENKLEQ